jgi:hypothetical protein
MTATSPKAHRFNPWWKGGAATLIVTGLIVAGLLGTGVIKLPSQPNEASTTKFETDAVKPCSSRTNGGVT